MQEEGNKMKNLQQNEQNKKFQKSLEELIDATYYCKRNNIHFRTLDEDKICDIYYNIYHNVFTNLDPGVNECIQIQDEESGNLSVRDIKNNPWLLKERIEDIIAKLTNEADGDYSITLANRLHTWRDWKGLDMKKFYNDLLSDNFNNKDLKNSSRYVVVSELCGYVLEDFLTVYIDRLKQIKNKKEFKKQFVYFIAFINDVKRERDPFTATFTEKSRKIVDDFIDKHYKILFDIRFIKKELNGHNLQIGDIMYVKLYNSYDLKSKNYGKCGFMDKLNSISHFYYCLHNCRGIDRLFRFNYFIESRFSSEYSGDKKIIL